MSGLGLSVVVPVYNEAGVLEACVSRMLREFKALGMEFELVVCENGSTDDTLDLARQLATTHSEVRVEHLVAPDYGQALRRGILCSRYEIVNVVNIDFWDTEFVRSAFTMLGQCDMVVGSKNMPGAWDARPAIRRVITRGFNVFLRIVFGFRGTDTHGLKVLKRDRLVRLFEQCVTNHFVYDTELVLRAERDRVRIREIPVAVRELRAPSIGALLRRVPRVVWDLVKLRVALGSS